MLRKLEIAEQGIGQVSWHWIVLCHSYKEILLYKFEYNKPTIIFYEFLFLLTYVFEGLVFLSQ